MTVASSAPFAVMLACGVIAAGCGGSSQKTTTATPAPPPASSTSTPAPSTPTSPTSPAGDAGLAHSKYQVCLRVVKVTRGLTGTAAAQACSALKGH